MSQEQTRSARIEARIPAPYGTFIGKMMQGDFALDRIGADILTRYRWGCR